VSLAERLPGISVLTFDCYGTLIDWETGILETLRPMLAGHGCAVPDAEVLELYAEFEAAAESGPYKPYREVLGLVTDGLGRRLGFAPTPAERGRLAESLPGWKPFPDTVAALRRLAGRFDLGVISNVDDELFEGTSALLGEPFEYVVTARQVGAYKPSAANFVTAAQVIGRPLNRVLHAAQSVYHDIVPARVLGLATAWVNRASVRPGVGVAPKAEAQPDLEVADLKSLADALL
jgi:2-haloacid dehalogenase